MILPCYLLSFDNEKFNDYLKDIKNSIIYNIDNYFCDKEKDICYTQNDKLYSDNKINVIIYNNIDLKNKEISFFNLYLKTKIKIPHLEKKLNLNYYTNYLEKNDENFLNKNTKTNILDIGVTLKKIYYAKFYTKLGINLNYLYNPYVKLGYKIKNNDYDYKIYNNNYLKYYIKNNNLLYINYFKISKTINFKDDISFSNMIYVTDPILVNINLSYIYNNNNKPLNFIFNHSFNISTNQIHGYEYIYGIKYYYKLLKHLKFEIYPYLYLNKDIDKYNILSPNLSLNLIYSI